MYRRFLNNDDYLGIITPEALAQLTRGNDARFIQAEESAEMSIVEYLSENYEIEKELAKGKYIAEYDRRITYLNPEKPDVPLNKNDAFQKVQKRHVQEKR